MIVPDFIKELHFSFQNGFISKKIIHLDVKSFVSAAGNKINFILFQLSDKYFITPVEDYLTILIPP
jgi:hypothetical protein